MGCNLKGVAALLFVATWAAIAILAEADADPSRHGIRFGIRKHYRPRPPPVRFHDRWHKHDRLPLRHQITRPHSHFFGKFTVVWKLISPLVFMFEYIFHNVFSLFRSRAIHSTY